MGDSSRIRCFVMQPATQPPTLTGTGMSIGQGAMTMLFGWEDKIIVVGLASHRQCVTRPNGGEWRFREHTGQKF